MKSNFRHPQPSVGRPRRSQHEIEAILRRHVRSGLSLLAFARKHDLCYATLLRWRRHAVADGQTLNPIPASTPTFVPIELEPAVRNGNDFSSVDKDRFASGASGAEFVLNWAPNQSLWIPAKFDPAELRRLLDVLGVQP